MKMPSPPYRRIGSIWLPGGGEFEVWSNYAIIFEVDRKRWPASIGDICPVASPALPRAYLPAVREMFENFGLLSEKQVIHWVGRQIDIEHVCTCFGILEPGASEPPPE